MQLKKYLKQIFLLFTLFSLSAHAEQYCTFSTYTWNTLQRKATDFQQHRIPYADIKPEHRDAASGCTLCREDQVSINYPGIEPFRVCHFYAKAIQATFDSFFNAGAQITSVVAYRVGKTRGPVDSQGNRTGYSNHAFGIALDINGEQNGLYTNCLQFNERCQLIKGGPWHPQQPGSLHADHEIVRALKSLGFKWGGEIAGRQKDFMHFSPSGY